MKLKNLTKIIVLTLLFNCAEDNVNERLPDFFVTNIKNSDSYLLHLQEAKKEISKLTNRKYNDAFVDIDLDGKADPYFIVNDFTAYTTLTKDKKTFEIPANQKAWIKIETNLIYKAKEVEKMKDELKKLNLIRQII